MLTLNQEIELLKGFATKHKAINTFRFGYELITGSNSSPVYPLMEVILQNVSLNKGVVSRKYLIAISDLVNKDSSNENHVLSDCEQYCMHLPAYLRQVRNSGLLGNFNLNEDISLTDFTDRGIDTVAGHEFEITLTSNIGAIGCDLPINSGDVLDDNYIHVGGSFAGNFIVEIKDQNGNTLETFNTSGTYTVEVLQQIMDTITSNTATIIDPIN